MPNSDEAANVKTLVTFLLALAALLAVVMIPAHPWWPWSVVLTIAFGALCLFGAFAFVNHESKCEYIIENRVVYKSHWYRSRHESSEKAALAMMKNMMRWYPDLRFRIVRRVTHDLTLYESMSEGVIYSYPKRCFLKPSRTVRL